MIDLHYWPTPNGKKLTIQLEESGIDYAVIDCEIGRGAQFEERFYTSVPIIVCQRLSITIPEMAVRRCPCSSRVLA